MNSVYGSVNHNNVSKFINVAHCFFDDNSLTRIDGRYAKLYQLEWNLIFNEFGFDRWCTWFEILACNPIEKVQDRWWLSGSYIHNSTYAHIGRFGSSFILNVDNKPWKIAYNFMSDYYSIFVTIATFHRENTSPFKHQPKAIKGFLLIWLTTNTFHIGANNKLLYGMWKLKQNTQIKSQLIQFSFLIGKNKNYFDISESTCFLLNV